MTDALESLRAEWSRIDAKGYPPDVWAFVERLLAAAEAERAEVARLAHGHDEYNRVNQILTAENDTLRGALRGFLAWYMDDTGAPSQLRTVVAAARAALNNNNCACSQGGRCCRE